METDGARDESLSARFHRFALISTEKTHLDTIALSAVQPDRGISSGRQADTV